jgi:hypothetical protein
VRARVAAHCSGGSTSGSCGSSRPRRRAGRLTRAGCAEHCSVAECGEGEEQVAPIAWAQPVSATVRKPMSATSDAVASRVLRELGGSDEARGSAADHPAPSHGRVAPASVRRKRRASDGKRDDCAYDHGDDDRDEGVMAGRRVLDGEVAEGVGLLSERPAGDCRGARDRGGCSGRLRRVAARPARAS